ASLRKTMKLLQKVILISIVKSDFKPEIRSFGKQPERIDPRYSNPRGTTIEDEEWSLSSSTLGRMLIKPPNDEEEEAESLHRPSFILQMNILQYDFAGGTTLLKKCKKLLYNLPVGFTYELSHHSCEIADFV
ncbi:hypothetical protein KI387_007429, partial [Taxus chinensis]